MVKSCAAYACTNQYGKSINGETISFHTFPLKNPNLLKEWLSAMKRDQWKPSKFSLICSKHFLESDYNSPSSLGISLKKKYLKKSAVLNSLKDISGLPIIKGPRKTFVVGFYISALSILSISKTLLTRSESPFEYVLTYRFSQDIIEMYFSKIRSRFEWNNNPNTLQFKYALRSLLLENKIESPSTAHCVQISEQENNAENVAVDPAVAELLLSSNVWRADVTHYISGYIVKKILQFIDCPECAESLYDNSNISGDHGYSNTPSLLTSKRYGNLVVPSNSVCKVVSCVDKLVRTSLCKWSSFDKQAKLAITSTVLQETKNYTFSSIQNHSMENHILDGNFRDDHITILIKLIVKNYLTIFLHQFGRVYTERLIKNSRPSRRNKLTKTILFYKE